MARWTRFVLRHRRVVLGVWVVVLLAGGYANSKLTPLLSNTFAVPGTDSDRVRATLERSFGDRPDGSFTAVFRVRNSHDPALYARLQAVVARAARVVPSGKPTKLLVAGPHVVYGDIVSTLSVAQAKGYAVAVLRALGRPPGAQQTYVTGAGPIQHDLDPIFNQDLRHGELEIAIPIALLVLVAVFGISAAVTIPLLFAACTIMGTLGIMYGVAHLATTPTYTTNLVELIGLGLAIDYSLLVVYRFREELARGRDRDDAVVRTMETAGRAVVFSGAAVALGLLLLVAMPLPFMRMMGVAGFLIPVVSVAAAATLQPALLSLYGRRGVARKRILPGEPVDAERGMWARLARQIMRRPFAFLVGGVAILLAAATPLLWLKLTPGSTYGIPRTPQSIRGFDVLQRAVGPGAVAPAQVLVGAPSVRTPAVQAAIGRLVASVRRDPEVAAVYSGTHGRYVDPGGAFEQVVIAGRHDYGFPQEQAFVHRLRRTLVPAARFPAGTTVLVGGAPGQGVDFLARAYKYFPPLIAAVLVLTYFLLARAFRSLLLPLKAVLLNLLSVGAAYGMLVVVFKWGVGHALFGLYQFGQVEGWIPIFLFAMLFGLSMDYEVFIVTRMREAWDATHDNTTAVAHGLERTGRIITAAAVIMCAAFSGFIAGRIVGLQEFGLGLAVAVFVDATLVRSLLVPSLMAILGRWNWWLPGPLARLVRVQPSPLAPRLR
ncbi:MAG: MMPL family transporter [Actinobacteria bacterium]|nr:MMPL family transporter [Actinomycetota bacterium]